ncbi:LysR family transcriptional regulator [Pseudomonas sp. DWP3-1-2]|uniref:LysR family transcriptional regulator n=1 Tax=Pseudomonas sp. DWP3-1-2 TaxID=2804645 RepID=UPI003CEB6BCA
MKILLAVIEAESLAGGARLMGLSPPSATRAIAALENRLGILLLARNTRSLRLTEAGRRYVEDCKRILLELQEAEELASGSSIRARGNLTVTAPVMFGELFLIPLIKDYLCAHAEVAVNALLVDRMVNMLDEGVDVALRIGQLPEGGFHALKVGEIRPVICAAPSFLDRVGRPASPRDLLSARIVTVFGAAFDADEVITRAHALLKMMDSELTRSPFLAGTTATLADVANYAYIAHAPEGNVSLEDYPNVRAWLARVEALPGFVPMQRTAAGLQKN